jgi:hypothetical protein
MIATGFARVGNMHDAAAAGLAFGQPGFVHEQPGKAVCSVFGRCEEGGAEIAAFRFAI